MHSSLKTVYINCIWITWLEPPNIFTGKSGQCLSGKMAARGKEIKPSNQRPGGRKCVKGSSFDSLESGKVRNYWKNSIQPVWGFEQADTTHFSTRHTTINRNAHVGRWPGVQAGHQLAVLPTGALSLSLKMEITNPACPTESDISTMVRCLLGAKSCVYYKEVIFLLVIILPLTSTTSCTWRPGGRFWISVLFSVIQASAHPPTGVFISFENEVL